MNNKIFLNNFLLQESTISKKKLRDFRDSWLSTADFKRDETRRRSFKIFDFSKK
jgi:hypothetical protein